MDIEVHISRHRESSIPSYHVWTDFGVLRYSIVIEESDHDIVNLAGAISAIEQEYITLIELEGNLSC